MCFLYTLLALIFINYCDKSGVTKLITQHFLLWWRAYFPFWFIQIFTLFKSVK